MTEQIKEKCGLEPGITLSKSGNVNVLPGMILQRDDLAIVVTGSPACVRGIYKAVQALHKRNHLFICPILPEDYGSDAWKKKLAASVNMALRYEGLGGIIVYASCPDFLNRMNTEDIAPLLNNPDHVPVRVLFRGALVSPSRPPKKYLQAILDELPETGKKYARDFVPMPPVQTDFAGVSELLQCWDTYNVLLDAGGCSECFTLPREQEASFRLVKTRFETTGAMVAGENAAAEVIFRNLPQERTVPCCLLSSIMPGLLKMKASGVEEILRQKGVPVRLFETDGRRSSQEGVAAALLVLAGTEHRPAEKPAGTDLEHIGWDGYEAVVPEQLPLEELPRALSRVRMNWVVSAAAIPLAAKLEQEQGIPYMASVPVGLRSMHFWRNRMNFLMRGDHEKDLEVEKMAVPRSQTRFLLAGDPVLMDGIRQYLRGQAGCPDVTCAIYAPVASQKEWYEKMLPELDRHLLHGKDHSFTLFSSRAEWKTLVQKADCIVRDPLLRDSVAASAEGCGKHWILLPDGLLSRGLADCGEYRIFGKKGAAWLEEQIGQ